MTDSRTGYLRIVLFSIAALCFGLALSAQSSAVSALLFAALLAAPFELFRRQNKLARLDASPPLSRQLPKSLGVTPSIPRSSASLASTATLRSHVQVVARQGMPSNAVRLASLLRQDGSAAEHHVIAQGEHAQVGRCHAAFRSAFARVIQGHAFRDRPYPQLIGESMGVPLTAAIRSLLVELAVARPVRATRPAPARAGGVYLG